MPLPLIVLDTDVVVTALLGREDATSFRVVRAVYTGYASLAVSDAFLREVLTAVHRPRVAPNIRDGARAFEIGLELAAMGRRFRPNRYDWPSIPDPQDYWQPDLAWEAGADYIVAWDPHLTGASLPFPVEVLRPPELVARLRLP